jgi:hypothetical protein
MTKETLRTQLRNVINDKASKDEKGKIRNRMEDRLAPWVVANLSASPELLAEDFIFIHLMSVTTIVQNLDSLAKIVCSLLHAYSMCHWIHTGASSVIMP